MIANGLVVDASRYFYAKLTNCIYYYGLHFMQLTNRGSSMCIVIRIFALIPEDGYSHP